MTENQSTRIKSLLELVGLENRFIEKDSYESTNIINYLRINEILNKERTKSISYLKKCVNNRK